MNKLHKILLVFLVIFITGCSSDDDNNLQNLKVLQSDTEYASLGGNGKIEVSAIDAITVKSSEAWCKPAVSGNTITITVDQNADINGRHATILIESGNEKTSVTITQLGTTFVIDNPVVQLPITGGEVDITYKSETTLTIKIDPNDTWLSYTLKDGVITFTATKTKNTRTGTVEITSGKLTKIVKIEQNIIQFEYEDYIGSYLFKYTNDFLDEDEMIITLTEKEKGVSYTIDGPNFNYPFQINYLKDGSLEVRPQLLEKDVVFDPPFGDGNAYDVYLGLWGTTASMTPVTNNPAVSLKGVFSIVDDKISFTFTDGGGWEHGQVDALCFSFFDENNLYKGDYYGETFLATVFDITMIKQ